MKTIDYESRSWSQNIKTIDYESRSWSWNIYWSSVWLVKATMLPWRPCSQCWGENYIRLCFK